MLNQLRQRLFSQQPAAQRRNQSLRQPSLVARAEASAGTDLFHAIELRRAIAFLGVVELTAWARAPPRWRAPVCQALTAPEQALGLILN